MIDAPDYAALQAQLRAEDAAMAPAELHGLLCARASVSPEVSMEQWLEAAFGEAGVAQDLTAELREQLRGLLAWTLERLERMDFHFRLFLPADDFPLAERTDALAGWCAGFLAGLGTSGLTDPEALPDEAGEFVRDLGELARAQFDAESASEEEESAFVELVEYTRVGAMLLFETLRGPEAGEALH